MASEWMDVDIEQIASKIAMGPFGSDIKTDNFVSAGVPVIRGGNLTSGRFHGADFVFLTEEKADQLANANAFPGDLVFTHRGTLGQVGLIPAKPFTRYVVSQSQMLLRCDPRAADPAFIYYFFKSDSGQHALLMNTSQTGVPAISRPTTSLKSIRLSLPPLHEQRAIAHILGTLDDKIELNRRMNETLEAMARALFKSWFVDFEPVRAKMEGRDPGLPKAIADLFPDRFVESELGEIPKGWEVKRLGDLLELAYGKALKAEDRRVGNVPVFGSNGQVGWHDERLVAGPGIVIGRKGNPGVVTWAPTDFFAIDTTFYVVPARNCHSLHFLVQALKIHNLASLGADSAVPGLNRNMAYMSTQVLPPRPILDKFDSYASAIALRVHECNKESRTLAVLRDMLLPKLISGELRVTDAERPIETTL